MGYIYLMLREVTNEILNKDLTVKQECNLIERAMSYVQIARHS